MHENVVELSWAGLNVPLNTLQINSETVFPANLSTGAKHSAFSTNHLTDTDKTKQNYKQGQHRNLNHNARARKLLISAVNLKPGLLDIL